MLTTAQSFATTQLQIAVVKKAVHSTARLLSIAGLLTYNAGGFQRVSYLAS